MDKHELKRFCEGFMDEIDILIKLDGKTLEFTGIVDIKYHIDANGTGHLVLTPAVSLLACGDKFLTCIGRSGDDLQTVW